MNRYLDTIDLPAVHLPAWRTMVAGPPQMPDQVLDGRDPLPFDWEVKVRNFLESVQLDPADFIRGTPVEMAPPAAPVAQRAPAPMDRAAQLAVLQSLTKDQRFYARLVILGKEQPQAEFVVVAIAGKTYTCAAASDAGVKVVFPLPDSVDPRPNMYTSSLERHNNAELALMASRLSTMCAEADVLVPSTYLRALKDPVATSRLWGQFAREFGVELSLPPHGPTHAAQAASTAMDRNGRDLATLQEIISAACESMRSLLVAGIPEDNPAIVGYVRILDAALERLLELVIYSSSPEKSKKSTLDTYQKARKEGTPRATAYRSLHA